MPRKLRQQSDSPAGKPPLRGALVAIHLHEKNAERTWVVNAGALLAQYGAAFEIVKAVQELRAVQSQDAVFKQELVELRLTWKAKRNFMKLLATFD